MRGSAREQEPSARGSSSDWSFVLRSVRSVPRLETYASKGIERLVRIRGSGPDMGSVFGVGVFLSVCLRNKCRRMSPFVGFADG